MSQISLKSLSGITSITTPAGVDNQLTFHTNDTTQRVKVTQSGIDVTGVVTATSYYGDGSNLTGIAADKIFEGNTEVETIDTGSNGHIKFTTEGTEKVRITSAGRVAIGTDTIPTQGLFFVGVQTSSNNYVSQPAARFAVEPASSPHGDASAVHIGQRAGGSADPAITFHRRSGDVAWKSWGARIHQGNLDSLRFSFSLPALPGSHSFTDEMIIKRDVGVGIGTHNPTAKLEIKGSNNPLVKIVQDTSGIARLNLESATNDGYQYSGIGLGDGTNDAELMWTTGGFDINVGNAVRLRINSNGAWGAGTNFGTAGQVLTSQGSGSAVQWATPSSGLAMADQWRKKATQNINGSRVLLTGWERPDRSGTGGGAYVGSGMSISGNYFSFPATGIYLITFDWSINCSFNNVRYASAEIETTKDNGSNWIQAARAFIHINRPTGTSTGHTASCNFIMDVENITNDEVKFTSSIDNVGDHQVLGDEDVNLTTATFLRLGDT